jgi:peptide/nickel transport system substrate-binding protein
MKRRQSGRLMLALLGAVAIVAAGSAAWVGSQRATASSGAAAATQAGGSGILRIGTTSYIDSFNPFNYIEAQGLNAMEMVYPQLVQYGGEGKSGLKLEGDWAKSWKVSNGGKAWTFKLYANTTWSDGKAMTADDAAWTINTTLRYQNGATAVLATGLAHVKRATAVNPTTLVIQYEAPVGNVLSQLEQLIIVPRHVFEPLEKKHKGGGALKTYRPQDLISKGQMVTGGAYTVKSYEKKGTTAFIPDPNFWGPKSHADAVALTYYTNADSMIADLRNGDVDWIDQVPFNAVGVLSKDKGIVVDKWPGDETTNITWNSNPRKLANRELLDPRVKKALSMCVSRDKIISVVFHGYASKVESIVGHISPLENPNLGPLKYDCKAANAALDKLGYKRGSDGIRVAPVTTGKYAQTAHSMKYEIITPTSTDFNVNRSFEIVKEGFAKLGVKVTQKVGGDSTASYALETDAKCDATKSIGYSKFDIALWDWIGYPDPDVMLSVLIKSQWCSFSDTGYDNPVYDALYKKQGVTVSPSARKALVYKLQKIVYDDFAYTQLTNHVGIDAHTKKWTGFVPQLNAFGKTYYTSPRTVG